jgi:C4-dicarboxylate-specific signal transduction histidine kinase
LTASIAHEVNQPLTAVVNNANASISLLPKGAPDLEEIREALTDILKMPTAQVTSSRGFGSWRSGHPLKSRF